MYLAAAFLGTAGGAGLYGGSSISWWQTVGGLVVVFVLLLVSLKLLGRWNKRTGNSESSLLSVWHLGPKKEIQVLRLADQVHYIYRHDGAMVVLQTEQLADYESKQDQPGPRKAPGHWRETMTRALPFWNGVTQTEEIPPETRARAAQG